MPTYKKRRNTVHMHLVLQFQIHQLCYCLMSASTPSTSSSNDPVVDSQRLQTVQTRGYRSWKSDGSHELVLDWLETGLNYAMWKGGDGSGRSKRSVIAEVQTLLGNEGIARTYDQVKDRLFSMQRKFSQAMDWRSRTGNGLMGNPDEEQSVKVHW